MKNVLWMPRLYRNYGCFDQKVISLDGQPQHIGIIRAHNHHRPLAVVAHVDAIRINPPEDSVAGKNNALFDQHVSWNVTQCWRNYSINKIVKYRFDFLFFSYSVQTIQYLNLVRCLDISGAGQPNVDTIYTYIWLVTVWTHIRWYQCWSSLNDDLVYRLC